MTDPTKSSRRDFLMAASTGALVSTLAPSILREAEGAVAANDRIQLATIGIGFQGLIDTQTALKVPGVELVAVADCYDGRLQRTKELFGDGVATTRDYQEILDQLPSVELVLLLVDQLPSQGQFVFFFLRVCGDRRL